MFRSSIASGNLSILTAMKQIKKKNSSLQTIVRSLVHCIECVKCILQIQYFVEMHLKNNTRKPYILTRNILCISPIISRSDLYITILSARWSSRGNFYPCFEFPITALIWIQIWIFSNKSHAIILHVLRLYIKIPLVFNREVWQFSIAPVNLGSVPG